MFGLLIKTVMLLNNEYLKYRLCLKSRHMNENGFILPVTMILLFIVTSSLFHQISIYEREKRFHFELEQKYNIDHMLQMATVDLITLVKTDEIVASGMFDYTKGKIYYWILAEDDEMIQIEFTVLTDKNRQRNVEMIIDKNQYNVINWLEKATI